MTNLHIHQEDTKPSVQKPCAVAGTSFFIQPDHSVVGLSWVDGHAVLTATPIRDAVAITLGWEQLLVLHTNGTLSSIVTGKNATNPNPVVIPDDLGFVVEIGSHGESFYARDADGVLSGWGRDGGEHVADLGYINDCNGLHACRHHLLVHTRSGDVMHTGSLMGNDADTYPLVRQGIQRLHASDIRAIAMTSDHRVIDLYDARIGTIAQDENIVDVVTTRSLYGLLYANGRVVVLNRYACMVDDDPLYVDPVILAGVSCIIANGDVLTFVGFDGRIWAVRSDEQFGYNPQPVLFPDSLRVKVWPGLSTQPEDYDDDACHEANTIALRLGAIKQNHTYMNAPKLPVF